MRDRWFAKANRELPEFRGFVPECPTMCPNRNSDASTAYHAHIRPFLPPMRFVLILMILTVVAGGVVFGALNGARVPVDFYVSQRDVPVGAALLVFLLVGWLLGGLVAWVGQVPRLRRELRAARAKIRGLEASPSPGRQDAEG